MWLALLYALGTPLFFRSAFLNQNALLAHVVLFAWMVLTWPRPAAAASRAVRDWAVVGGLLGVGILLDYSAVPLALVFGCWALVDGYRRAGPGGALTSGAGCIAGAIGPVLLLLAYQWIAFGSPWFPAQRYMPDTQLSVVGWNGMSLPSAELLWRNLFDFRYGLFAFCPMLLAAFAFPWVGAPYAGPGGGPRVGRRRCLCRSLVFSSANQFAHLQWNTGVRYMVPIIPLLFLVFVPVAAREPPMGPAGAGMPTLLISLAVSMTREDVPVPSGSC